MEGGVWLTGSVTLVIGVVSAVLAFRAQRTTVQFEGYDEFTSHLRAELDRTGAEVGRLEAKVAAEKEACDAKLEAMNRELGDLRRQIRRDTL